MQNVVKRQKETAALSLHLQMNDVEDVVGNKCPPSWYSPVGICIPMEESKACTGEPSFEAIACTRAPLAPLSATSAHGEVSGAPQASELSASSRSTGSSLALLRGSSARRVCTSPKHHAFFELLPWMAIRASRSVYCRCYPDKHLLCF